ncbi:MAG: hypothetical protein JW986_04880 [Methanotrichaceae archaeon]|nr:hypothetical protein [Methanotrichaceae archaeon]
MREKAEDTGIASLDESSWERLFGGVVSDRDRIALILLREAGLDLESLLRLEISDLHLDGNSLRIGAKKAELQMASAEEMRSYLLAHRDQRYLLEGRCGLPLTPRWRRCVLDRLIPAGRASGL